MPALSFATPAFSAVTARRPADGRRPFLAAPIASRYHGGMRTRLVALGLVGFLAGCGSPGLEITAPTDGDTVFGAVRLAAAISSADGDTVAFYLDGTDVSQRLGDATGGQADGYSLTWFSTDTGNGAHTIYARADAGGESLEASIEIDVDNPTRAGAIPAGAVKMTPATDAHPPILEPAFTAVFEDCAPLGAPVSTAGAEDSPYITADGQELYTFFTPDASVPPQEQLFDRVTGIYRSVRDGAGWSEPERVWLSHHDDPALDGCETVFGDQLWFCTVRAGVEREIDIYVAHRDGEHWVGWESAGHRLNVELEVGELHVADAGNSIYYHSQRAGGAGDADIWVTHLEGGEWSDPVNVSAVNTEHTDGWPWVSADSQELWFTTGPAAPEIWRSVAVGGEWQAPEKVVGPFAGEPTFDEAGNLYFTHHFWDDATDSIIEADIYMCARK